MSPVRGGETPPSVRRLPIDMAYVQDVLIHLLRTPSPTGRTDEVVQYVGELLMDLGMDLTVTRRGVLNATLPGRRTRPDRAIAVHADTIGCMVTRLKDNGRLEVTQLGTHSARFAEGAHVTIFTDSDRIHTGTVLPLKSSGHQYGDEVDTQGVGWPLVEVRVDEPVDDAAGLAALGLQVGDFVALDANPTVTSAGYVKSRHLDDKAGIAAALGAFKSLLDARVTPLVSAHLLVTIAEEVGHGATHGLDTDVAEMVAVDNAVVAPGQQSREDCVNIAMLDSTGPFDYHFSRRLLALCEEHGVPSRRDTFRFYRSDAASAVEAGLEMRTALVGFGIDSSHGHERTRLDGIEHVAELLSLYLQTDLTFPDWDTTERGPLEEFPSRSVQPTPLEDRRRATDRDDGAGA
ncbi:MAG: Deblocking aminopeptidase @ Cyanophycinase 2 [uncultured Frankineae bacterium]|uniref:Deblocking aminopeptidase @ Cyanophycinase 2 n=1 Tax=uncultured Frankineae bacterium TaxID=437475 RepID=A0A6J4KSH7_9ACTN|nr:MAG: Deblocking aminopeptidase @ Cyanophycinase 2 [uncultured Frankineae bacterium]